MDKKLVKSIISSLLLHALFIGGGSFLIHKSSKIVFSPKKGAAAMKVKLSVFQEPTKSIPKPKEVAKVGKKKAKIKKEKKTIKKSQANTSKATKTRGSNEELAKYLNLVRAAILNNKFKSRMAKKLRLKGKVELYFKLVSPNRIDDVRLVKPSKFSQLNDSAIETVTSVSDLPVIPDSLEMTDIPITIEITYQ